jgi:branched-chain amino acid transport system permease protein
MVELIVWGIVLGSILTLGAIGLSLVYGVLRFANFAHGDLLTVGAYSALALVSLAFPALGLGDSKLVPFSFGWTMLIALPLAAASAALVAVAANRLVFRPLHRRRLPPLMLAISSLAIALLVRSVVMMVWGPAQRVYYEGLRTTYVLPGLNARVRADQLLIFGLAVLLVAALWLFLERTKAGKALRATSDNPELARISGIDANRMMTLTWIVGGGLAGIAGVFLGIDSQVRPDMGWNLLLPIFAAVILGSIGNIYGAMLGAIIVGISQQVSTMWLLPTYKPAVAFVILILTLLLRPRGIFGSRHAS